MQRRVATRKDCKFDVTMCFGSQSFDNRCRSTHCAESRHFESWQWGDTVAKAEHGLGFTSGEHSLASFTPGLAPRQSCWRRARS